MAHDDQISVRVTVTRWWSAEGFRWTIHSGADAVTLDEQELSNLILLLQERPGIRLLLEAALTGQGG